MPVVYRDTIRGEPRLGTEFPSAREDVLTETFAQVYEENPIKATKRFFELREDERTGPRLDAPAARQKLKDAGLEAHLKVEDAGITQAALDTLMERKRTELRRQEVFSRARGGLAENSQRLGLSIATTLMDPISMGLNFVPVVGQARYARYLANAGSLASRTGVRAGVGALEGTVGAALQEPFIYGMRTYEQADYDMVDSLLNVGLGGITGAGLHATIGTAGEGIEQLRARPSAIPRGEGLTAADRLIEARLARRIETNVEEAVAAYSKIEGTDGGRVLNTDLARELSPEYQADRTRSAAVHEPASYLVKKIYERKLAEAPGPDEDALVVFSAGGTGAGKTTGLDLLAEIDPRINRAQIIYDTNMNTLASSVAKIDAALAAGKEVRVLYTWRDPVDALNKGALPRAMRMGRTVPLEEHAKTHAGSAAVIKELAARYREDPRFGVTVIDNSHGRGKARLGNVEGVPELEYNRVREDLLANLEAEYRAGRISEAVYRGTRGAAQADLRGRARTGSGSQPQPQDRGREALSPLSPTAAERADLATPHVREAALRAAVGQAVEGRPVDVEPIFRSQELPAEDFARELEHGIDTVEIRALDEELEQAPEMRTTEEVLKAAEEEAQLAVADARAALKRLGQEYAEDPELVEGLAKAERWARVAEAATVCLTRGG